MFGSALMVAGLRMEAMIAVPVSLELLKQDGRHGGQSNLQPVPNISLCQSERKTARRMLS